VISRRNADCVLPSGATAGGGRLQNKELPAVIQHAITVFIHISNTKRQRITLILLTFQKKRCPKFLPSWIPLNQPLCVAVSTCLGFNNYLLFRIQLFVNYFYTGYCKIRFNYCQMVNTGREIAIYNNGFYSRYSFMIQGPL
jgi:hypothetical protein